jgi:ABC-type multidrug transport system fused ATPase/permease subunit
MRLRKFVASTGRVARILWEASPSVTLCVTGFSVLWGAMAVPSVYLEKLILDRLVANIGNPAWQAEAVTLGMLIGARMLVEALKNVLNIVTLFYRNLASRLLQARLDVIVAGKLSRLDVPTFDDPSFQDRYGKIEREAGRRAWGLMLPLTNLPSFVVGFASALGILGLLHLWIGLGVVLVTLPIVAANIRYIRKEYELEESMEPRYRLWYWLAAYLRRTRSFLELRILGIQEPLIRKMEAVQEGIVAGSMALNRKKTAAHALAHVPGILFYAAANVYLAVLAIESRISVGSYEMYLRALFLAQQNFSGLVAGLLQVYENYILIASLGWFLALEPRIGGAAGLRRPGPITESIELRDVWFRYQDGGPWALQGINLVLRPGERVGIVGENGAGKSTFVKLLARFYDPQQGRILVDGLDLRELDADAYQDKFSILFQNFETYPFSARETIGYGDFPYLDDLEAIRAAAQRTGIDEMVEALPLRYENPLHPHFHGGVEPSKGQWQRLALARILFKRRAEVLVLDEPTSNVDPEAEAQIWNDLMSEERGCILIFVSQVFGTMRRADRILVFDRGAIVEQGTHEQLLAAGGRYARLFELQAKGYR